MPRTSFAILTLLALAQPCSILADQLERAQLRHEQLMSANQAV